MFGPLLDLGMDFAFLNKNPGLPYFEIDLNATSDTSNGSEVDEGHAPTPLITQNVATYVLY